MGNVMRMTLNVKVTSSFFWLRKISDVNINMCCAKCFYGSKVKRVYDETRYRQAPYTIEVDIEPAKRFKAYYLCGLSSGMKYENNTHVAFVYAPGEHLRAESAQMEVTISNARRVDFESEDYTPDPPGEYTEEQRKCRNWIFANYIKDGMLPDVSLEKGVALSSSVDQLNQKIQKEIGLSELEAEHYLGIALATLPVQDEINSMVLHLTSENSKKE